MRKPGGAVIRLSIDLHTGNGNKPPQSVLGLAVGDLVRRNWIGHLVPQASLGVKCDSWLASEQTGCDAQEGNWVQIGCSVGHVSPLLVECD